MEFLGYTVSKRKPAPTERSIVAPDAGDGGIDTQKTAGYPGGYYGTYLDLDGAAKTEAELIKRYRDIAMMADCDIAIEDIVNQAIANLEGEVPVKLNLEDAELSEGIKKKITDEFNYLLNCLNFKVRAQDYFRRWYIDGRLHFHKVVDTAKLSEGIKDIRYIDPRKIKKIREIQKTKDPTTGVEIITGTNEYYVFNDKGLGAVRTITSQAQGVRLSKDAITFVPSGMVDMDNNMVLSYLHKAIKPANQLRMMENALVIYRLARAPERRIFYIDVGNLPKIKAEQYLKDIMNKYRNKIVYDANTGEVRDDKKFMSMLEDFWLPRREGGKGTQIETLPGGQNLGQMDDVLYFQKKLYESLNIPVSRLEAQSGFNLGRSSEITRDELKFQKFIQKLQIRFSILFEDILKTQLLLKKIITEADWDDIKFNIKYIFTEDAYYGESKNQEVLKARAEILAMLDPFVGKYFPAEWVQKEVLHFTDEQINDFKVTNEEQASAEMNYSEPLQDPNNPDNTLTAGQPVPATHPEQPDAEKNGPAALEKIKGEFKVKTAVATQKGKPKSAAKK